MITLSLEVIQSLLFREFGLSSDTEIQFFTTSGELMVINKVVLCRTENVQTEFSLFDVDQGGLNNPKNLRVFMIQSIETLNISEAVLKKIKKLNILKVWQLIALFDLLSTKKIPEKTIESLGSSLSKIPGFSVDFRAKFGEWFKNWALGSPKLTSADYFTFLAVLNRDSKISDSVDNTVLDIVPNIQ